MNLPSVHKKVAVTPWWKMVFFAPSFHHKITVACMATVGAERRLLTNVSGVDKVVDGALDRAAGQRQIFRNAVDAGPGFVFLVLSVVKVNIDQLRPVRKLVVIIEVTV